MPDRYQLYSHMLLGDIYRLPSVTKSVSYQRYTRPNKIFQLNRSSSHMCLLLLMCSNLSSRARTSVLHRTRLAGSSQRLVLPREEAHKRRDELLFKNEEEGDGGQVGARRDWSVFAKPEEIQTQSSGLGLYFKTLGYFLIVTFLMSLVGIAPLVANFLANEFTDSYTLVEAGADLMECERRYQVWHAAHYLC